MIYEEYLNFPSWEPQTADLLAIVQTARDKSTRQASRMIKMSKLDQWHINSDFAKSQKLTLAGSTKWL